MTITEFLLARIAEDEAVARAATTVGVPRVKYLGDDKWGKEYTQQMELSDDVRRGRRQDGGVSVSRALAHRS